MLSLKWIALIAMAVQNSVTPLIFRSVMTAASSKTRFSTVEAILMAEMIKLFLSLFLIFWEENQSVALTLATLKREIYDKPRDTMKLGIPAFLYFTQNICLQKASANLPAAVFQVTYQGKSLVVALCSVALLSKKLKRVQWVSIGIMGAGLAIVQLARSTESKQSSMANSQEQSIVVGLMFTVIGAFCSGFAGVYFEKMMKQPTKTTASLGGPSEVTKKPSMWVRNLQLAAFSMAIGIFNIMMQFMVSSGSSSGIRSSDGSGSDNGNEAIFHSGATEETGHYFLKGFSWMVWIMVLNNALGGLCVAFVIKYADNILKGTEIDVVVVVVVLPFASARAFKTEHVCVLVVVVVVVVLLFFFLPPPRICLCGCNDYCSGGRRTVVWFQFGTRLFNRYAGDLDLCIVIRGEH